MRSSITVSFLLIGSFLWAQVPVEPPKAPPKVVTNEYHGVTLEDPYQYMENLEDPEVLNWLKTNTAYSEAILHSIPGRETMLEKIRELDSRRESRISNVSITDDDVYYYLKTTPDDETGKLFYRKGFKGEEKLLLDPRKYGEDPERMYSILSLKPNEKGDLVAVRLAADGSENGELVVLDQTGKQVGETLELVEVFDWVSNEHLTYTKLNSEEIADVNRQLNLKVYWHELGTPVSQDKVVFSAENNPEIPMEPAEIPIVIYDRHIDKAIGAVVTVDNARKAYMAEGDLPNPDSWKQLSTQEDKVTDFVTSKDAVYYLSFKDAPNFKIVKSSLEEPEFSKGKVLIKEPEAGPIQNMAITKDGLFYSIKSNGVQSKLFFLPHGKSSSREIELPFTAGYLGMNSKGPEFSDIWVGISGWTSPPKRYKYDLATDTFELEMLSSPAEYPELENLVAKEITVTSHDGVKVPVSLIHHKDIKLDGQNPVFMYGYGSYGMSTGPFFSPLLMLYTTYGGVFVVPHVRGGGELGDAWHRAGQKLNKPNTWKDAIATAEYLIKEGYTNPDKLSIAGGSAGGIFVGRAITERPDLFAAAIPQVGVMNPVRAEETPNGPVNAPEFGTVKDPDEFRGLLEMDSYHQLEDGTNYPATLVTAGINDPRVIAWQPAKFAARMQVANASDNPILLHTDFSTGHGIGDQKSKAFENFANMFSFSLWQSGHPDFQPEVAIKD
ncbi:prolyl oligopeptidase family serine peptidase [Salinimicrobium flavum]|uniref:prolyl oligopeptidase n=1 Tax=Salinimicrobium flavum TaxID=1737065 RepID=A0ABW5IRW5_9FLAO